MKILIAECMQEISSFNPLPSHYEDFKIDKGDALLRRRGLNTSIGGALAAFDQREDVSILPTISACADSAGILSTQGWQRLATEILAAVLPHQGAVDALYISLHGAMGAVGEPDPEGFLLAEIRKAFGPDVPIVISLDLHGILTDRMLRQIDGLTIYQTYPHVDFADTGLRAARLLLDIVDRELRPIIARVVVPLLARGDECVTKTGLYGDVLADGQLLEQSAKALAAGVMIGNPFTDAPELCTQAIVVTEKDDGSAEASAVALAEAMWAGRHRLVGKLIAPEKAVALARHFDRPVIFTDAADATSSGASGDSNALIKALWEGGYTKRVLAQIVDAPAAKAAHAAGVGATLDVTLGGSVDRARFQPMKVRATVESLSRGKAVLETMGLPIDAGMSAVLTFENFTVLAISKPAFLFDRSLYYANGLDPQRFDLTIVKSPHTEFH
ncbi:MAG TPA: M81 family metallopeptidase, partial [Nordella sp.]|nr:M81 family metallopeptidase [Nordella sp.]